MCALSFVSRRRLAASVLIASCSFSSALAAAPVIESAVVVGAVGSESTLTVHVRCADAVAAAKSVAVTGSDGAPLAFTPAAESPVSLRLILSIRTKDTDFRVVAPGVDRTLPVPPMFFCRDSYAIPDGMEKTFPLRLRFTQRLDARQKPPRLSFVPEIPGALVHIDGHDLVITGELPTRRTLAIRFESDLLSADGRIFKAGEIVHAEIGSRPAGASFVFTEGVLSPNGSLGVPLNICNLSKAKVRVTSLAPENLVAALHGSEVRDKLMEDVAEKEVVFRTPPDRVEERLFDIRTSADKTGAPVRGVRMLTLTCERFEDDYSWENSTQSFVTVTDLAITPKIDGDDATTTVWVSGISTGEPVAGAEVVVRNAQNRVLARATTDASGIAKLAAPGGWLVTASKGDDFSYLKLDRAGLVSEEQAGARHGIRAGSSSTALLYADRGVHRGGDTIRLTALPRTAKDDALPAVPMAFTLIRPDGRVHATVLAKPGAGGFYSADFALPSDAPYGRYEATFGLPGANTTLERLALPVSAFEPLRLNTTLTPAPTSAKASRQGRELPLFAGAAPALKLNSRYRFGSPAAGLPSQVAMRLEPASVAFAAFPGFVFGYENEAEGLLLPSFMTPLDDKGERETQVALTSPPGVRTLGCTANVTEPGSRTDTAYSRVLWINAASVPGIAVPAEAPAVGKPFRFEIALATAEGKPAAPAEVRVVAERVVENWTLQRDRGSMLWRRTEEYAPAGEATVGGATFRDAKATAEFVFAGPGEHRLIATTADGARTVRTVYVSGAGAVAPGAAPHVVKLRPQKDSAKPGETVPVVVEAPFPGEALLTLESDTVIESRVVRLNGDKDTVSVTVPGSARGSVWVSLSEVRPLEANRPEWRPHLATGRAEIVVSHAERRLGVSVEAPAKAAPGTKVPVVVRVAGAKGSPVAVHCWAVDTGVLDITGYKTPDAYARFLGPRDSAVKSATTYDDLIPDFTRKLERIGAGDGAGVYRGNGMKNRKPVALVWSGIAMTDADGVLKLDPVMPDLDGEMRWMAVAAQDDRYGSAEKITRLSHPVILETSSPVFLAPGDRPEIPVALFNNTGAPVTVRLATSASGVSIEGALPESVTLPADGKPWRGVLKVRAGDTGDTASLSVVATGDFEGGRVASKLPLNLRAATPLVTRATAVELKPGSAVALKTLTKDFAAGSRTTLRVAPGSSALVPGLLTALVDYPYGCVEQTSSRMLALAAAGAAYGLPGADAGDAAKERVIALLRMGVDRLSLHRRSDGGLSYWADSGSSDPEGSRLAGEALIAARAAGVAVDDGFVRSLAEYLRRQLYRPETGSTDQAALCATLTGLGFEETNRIRWLTENAGGLTAPSVGRLALAKARAGDRTAAAALLLGEESRLLPAASLTRGRRFVSSVVDDAAVLDAYDAVSPGSPVAALYASTLSAMATERLNTLEQAALVGALARRSAVTPPVSGKPDVVYDDGVSPKVTATGTSRAGLDVTKPLVLKNRGDAPAIVVATTTGTVSGVATDATASGLSIRREYFDGVSGEPVDFSKPLRVGASLRVLLTLRSADASLPVPDVAVSDLFPACFEAEGRRPEEFDRRYDSGSRYDRGELREDRALAFVTVGREIKLEYRVRVVSAGRFALPPAQASSMYRPDVGALGEKGEIVVE